MYGFNRAYFLSLNYINFYVFSKEKQERMNRMNALNSFDPLIRGVSESRKKKVKSKLGKT